MLIICRDFHVHACLNISNPYKPVVYLIPFSFMILYVNLQTNYLLHPIFKTQKINKTFGF